MLVMGKINSSEANGPGKRAVLHLQGCTLNCAGCWNPESHAFDLKKDTNRWDIVKWVLSLEDVEGLTLSGGEPIQQAPQVLALMDAVHEAKPSFSIGMYTGYSKKELESGKYKWKSEHDADWVKGTPELWNEIKKHLDFAIVGRYNKAMACHDEPLRGSRNQEVLFFTSRYDQSSLSQQIAEVTIGEDALIQITGYPTEQFLDILKEKPQLVTASTKPNASPSSNDQEGGDLVGV